jgi:hypothetical protein
MIPWVRIVMNTQTDRCCAASGMRLGAGAAEALVAHPHLVMTSFTGSTAVGRGVGEMAGRLLKRVALELGGNNALIVFDDVDVEAVTSAAAFGSFFHQGQTASRPAGIRFIAMWWSATPRHWHDARAPCQPERLRPCWRPCSPVTWRARCGELRCSRPAACTSMTKP